MRAPKTFEAVAAAGLATALVAGCNSYQQPKPLPPNGTLGQVEHNLDYADTLDNLTLRQTISFQIGHQLIRAYNFTDSRLNQAKFSRLANYYVKMERPLNSPERTITIHPRDGHRNEQLHTIEAARTAREHDFVLVPSDAKLPKIFTNDELDGGNSLQGATYNFTAQSQTISVVQRPTDSYYQPSTFLGQFDQTLPTELCQSLVNVASLGSASDINISDRLAQETVCNGMGEAVAAVENDWHYGMYKSMEKINGGTVDIADTEYWIDPYTLPAHTYLQMATAMRPGK